MPDDRDRRPRAPTRACRCRRQLHAADARPSDPDPAPRPRLPAAPTTGATPPGGTNLSIGAGADGSSKASGTSYGNVLDGDLSTYWSPTGSTGRISIKWGSATAVSAIHIREAAGAAGNIGSWRVVNGDTGAVLATGTGAGVITFARDLAEEDHLRDHSARTAPRGSPSSKPTPANR